MNKKKNESEILHPEIEVAGVKVRPWTYDQFFDMLPLFLEASKTLKGRGIGLKDFETATGDGDAEKILSLLLIFRPVIPDVVALTLGKEAEEIRRMEFDSVISIALMILIQNAERIKNFSGLGKMAMQALVTA